MALISTRGQVILTPHKSRRITDYYKILGVSYNASQKQIDSAFRTLAKKYHPDSIKDTSSQARKSKAVEKFKRISDAYSILGNPNNRRKYNLLYKSTFGFRGNNPEEMELSLDDISEMDEEYHPDFDPREIYDELFNSSGKPRDGYYAENVSDKRFDDLANLDPHTRVRKEDRIDRIPLGVKPTYIVDDSKEIEGNIVRVGDSTTGYVVRSGPHSEHEKTNKWHKGDGNTPWSGKIDSREEGWKKVERSRGEHRHNAGKTYRYTDRGWQEDSDYNDDIDTPWNLNERRTHSNRFWRYKTIRISMPLLLVILILVIYLTIKYPSILSITLKMCCIGTLTVLFLVSVVGFVVSMLVRKRRI